MMLKFPVKASQITNLTDARYFAARAVEWIGFNLDPGTENAVSPQEVSAIKEWVEGPSIVAEFGLQSSDEIKSIVDYLEVDAVQISMFSDTKAIRESLSIPIFKEVVVEEASLQGLAAMLQEQATMVDYFIIDLAKNNIELNQLSKTAIDLLQALCADYQVLINFNASAETLKLFLEQVEPYGLVLLGGEEEKVGYKSFDELDEILDLLEVE